MNAHPLITPYTFKTRKEWRSWLESNHAQKTGIWIMIWKQKYRSEGVHYVEAIEEALCFGWIDGQMKGLNEKKFILHMAPRKLKSVWSQINKQRAEKLIAEGKMALAGLKKIAIAKENGQWDTAYSSKSATVIPIELDTALQQDLVAQQNFARFSNSARFQYIYWINQAKTKTTRQKRIEQTVKRARLFLKPGEKEIQKEE